ncbi:MAG: hypothetical protein RBG1_1C00001G0834 [candidate division Zixibacteria bacterium RBG-1]|nr:MAG: hypothetical protein RBG1_1C00001G0834 [candidate division Zixibacteria bacterium RBG-1]OGC83537.1 MAG: hypothetical protein A2V73_05940 [candidate division Zixibacteria bacterium RBG_19FT_COMBO_42_43]
MISFSTSWNATRNHSGLRIIQEIKDLGFDCLEINFQVSSEKFEEIKKSKKENQIQISSLHNVAPMPDGFEPHSVHKAFPLNSPDDSFREKSIELTKNTIDNAHDLKAEAVVLHLGESQKIEILDLEQEYIKAKIKSETKSDELEELKNKFIRERNKISVEGTEKIIQALNEIIPYAQDKNIKLGFENRYYYSQFPTLEETEIIFKEFPNSNVGLWLDVGHQATLEYLGFVEKNAYLKKFGHRLIGTHLMDCKEIYDHKAPGTGNIDYSGLKSYLKPDTIKVLELGPKVTPPEVKSGFEYLQQMGLA